jgi:hypothetical protein
MVYYRRRTNWVGWLAFFGIGAGVFVGLVIALQFLKQRQDRIDQKAADQVAKDQSKREDPRKNIIAKVEEAYKAKGQFLNQAAVRMNLVDKVRSSKAPDKEYAVGRIQHRALAKREDDGDPPEMDEVFIVEVVRTKTPPTVNLTKVSWENWEKARDQFGFDEEVTKKLGGE